MPEAATRVIIADDHPIVRSGLKHAIELDLSMRIIAECDNGEAALQQILALTPDIAVLDLDMPRFGGLTVARKLREKNNEVPLVILTIHSEEELFQAAIDAGVKGYLLKDQALVEIARGLRAVLSGKHYVSSALTDYLLTTRREPSTAVHSVPGFYQLTETERHVLRLVSEDRSSKDIGLELCIHHRTVENHRNNICRKLNLKGSNALLRFALANRAGLQAQPLPARRSAVGSA